MKARNLATEAAQELGTAQDLLHILQKDQSGFQLLAQHIKSLCGINLPATEKNQSLMASRLLPLLRARGFTKYKEYSHYLANEASSQELQEFVSQLTTNTTQFFRESEHFEFLKKHLDSVLVAKKKQGSHELRVWCAAASAGQEPYTIAMVINEALPANENWSVKFLATDIDTDVLKKAAAGVYSEAEAKTAPSLILQKYFTKANVDGEVKYKINNPIRSNIRFAQLNLIETPYPFQHKFDIIFCRNVLIYFDQPTSAKVVENLQANLSDHGYIFLGHSEAGAMRNQPVTCPAPAVYQKKGAR